jgi:hypothetical protein
MNAILPVKSMSITKIDFFFFLLFCNKLTSQPVSTCFLSETRAHGFGMRGLAANWLPSRHIHWTNTSTSTILRGCTQAVPSRPVKSHYIKTSAELRTRWSRGDIKNKAVPSELISSNQIRTAQPPYLYHHPPPPCSRQRRQRSPIIRHCQRWAATRIYDPYKT